MEKDDLDDRDLAEIEQHELAIMVNVNAVLGACAFCAIDSTPEELGLLEIFIPENRSWVCHECGHERAPILARLLDLARAAEDYAFEAHGPQESDEPAIDDDGEAEGTVH
jgi:hypothetical protein